MVGENDHPYQETKEFPTSPTTIYNKVYHLPKGTTIFKMVVDFQGICFQKIRDAFFLQMAKNGCSFRKLLQYFPGGHFRSFSGGVWGENYGGDVREIL